MMVALETIGIIELIADYGVMGIFIGYLIFDRQFILRKVIKALDDLTDVIKDLDKDIIKRNRYNGRD